MGRGEGKNVFFFTRNRKVEQRSQTALCHKTILDMKCKLIAGCYHFVLLTPTIRAVGNVHLKELFFQNQVWTS